MHVAFESEDHPSNVSLEALHMPSHTDGTSIPSFTLQVGSAARVPCVDASIARRQSHCLNIGVQQSQLLVHILPRLQVWKETSPLWGRFGSIRRKKINLKMWHTRNVRIVRYLHRKRDKCINDTNYRNNLYIITTLITIHGINITKPASFSTCKNLCFFRTLYSFGAANQAPQGLARSPCCGIRAEKFPCRTCPTHLSPRCYRMHREERDHSSAETHDSRGAVECTDHWTTVWIVWEAQPHSLEIRYMLPMVFECWKSTYQTYQT